MKAVFSALGIKASDTEIKSVVKQMDVDGDGEISFNEFVRVMGPQFYRSYNENEIRAAFRHFDKDNSGFITRDELRQALNKMGRHYSAQDIEHMVRAVDRNGDGQISIEEFTQLLL